MYYIINYQNVLENINDYSFSVMLFNIFVYTMLMFNFFFIFFLFNTKTLKTLNELKYVYNIQFVSISIFLILMSLAGIPPLSGFLSKFLIFIQIFFKKNLIIFLLFIFLNTFSIYFYIQNFRFLVSKKISNIFIYKNYFVILKSFLVFIINVLNFFNIFAVFYTEEFVIYLNLTSSFISL